MATFADLLLGLEQTGHRRLFLLLDGAGIPGGRAGLPLQCFAEVDSLFAGELADELEEVAPYLARLGPLDDGSATTIEQLLRQHVAILVAASGEGAGFAALHRHFRKFNVVYRSDGRPVFFRYYDPRVIPDVLAVFSPADVKAFFGPVDAFVLVDLERQLVSCTHRAGNLVVSEL